MPYNLSITSFTDDLETTINAPTGGAFETTPVARYGGRMRVITGNFEVATTDLDANDIIVLARLPATAVVSSIKLSSDALDAGSSLTFDVGIYDENQAVLALDVFATDSTIFQSATAAPGTEMRYENSSNTDTHGDTLWELGGVAAPGPGGVMYDIAITFVVAAATAAALTLGYEIFYTID